MNTDKSITSKASNDKNNSDKSTINNSQINLYNSERYTHIREELTDFSTALNEYSTESWNQFPGIDLYMDQVVTYLERLLKLFDTDATGKVITSSMVNNYVKEGYLKRPVNKKYDRIQLATLYIMSMLKPIIPIPLIAGSLSNLNDEHNYQVFFEKLAKLQDEAFTDIAGKMTSTLENISEEDFVTKLHLFALQLTSEANARKIVAERILTALNKNSSQSSDKDKK